MNENIKNLSIDSFELSIRAKQVVKELKCTKLGDLTQYTEAEILKIPNIGKTTLREIMDLLERYGLVLLESSYYRQAVALRGRVFYLERKLIEEIDLSDKLVGQVKALDDFFVRNPTARNEELFVQGRDLIIKHSNHQDERAKDKDFVL